MKAAKRGFTLAEMAVAMAVTAVLLVSITTLVVMIVKESERNAADNRSAQDVQLVRVLVTGWFGNFSGRGYEFTADADENGSVLRASRDGEASGSVAYRAGKLSVNGVLFGVESVKEVTFEVVPGGAFDSVIKVCVDYGGAAPMVLLLRLEG